jgi:hypothetical protein
MKLTNLTAGTILALAVALPTGQVLSQAPETTVNTKASQTEQNIDQAGGNLQGADNTTTETTVVDDLQGADNTTTETTVVDDLQDTGNTVDTTVDNTTENPEATTVDDLQDTGNTVETTVDNTTENPEETAVDDLQDASNTVETTVDNIGEEPVEAITTEPEEIVDQVVETDAVVEEKFNWDWLGLLGLLGLFGLTGKNRKTEVAHRNLGVGSATDTNGINHEVNDTNVNNISNNVHK